MKLGLLWYDADQRLSLQARLAEAAARFAERFGRPANRCHVHPEQFFVDPVIAVVADPTILKHHFWVGRDEALEPARSRRGRKRADAVTAGATGDTPGAAGLAFVATAPEAWLASVVAAARAAMPMRPTAAKLASKRAVGPPPAKAANNGRGALPAPEAVADVKSNPVLPGANLAAPGAAPMSAGSRDVPAASPAPLRRRRPKRAPVAHKVDGAPQADTAPAVPLRGRKRQHGADQESHVLAAPPSPAPVPVADAAEAREQAPTERRRRTAASAALEAAPRSASPPAPPTVQEQTAHIAVQPPRGRPRRKAEPEGASVVTAPPAATDASAPHAVSRGRAKRLTDTAAPTPAAPVGTAGPPTDAPPKRAERASRSKSKDGGASPLSRPAGETTLSPTPVVRPNVGPRVRHRPASEPAPAATATPVIPVVPTTKRARRAAVEPADPPPAAINAAPKNRTRRASVPAVVAVANSAPIGGSPERRARKRATPQPAALADAMPEHLRPASPAVSPPSGRRRGKDSADRSRPVPARAARRTA